MNAVRLKNVEYGTVIRVIRVENWTDRGLMFKCRDETYGGICWLGLEQYTNGKWEVVS